MRGYEPESTTETVTSFQTDGLHTTFTTGTDGRGNLLSEERRRTFERLNKRHMRSRFQGSASQSDGCDAPDEVQRRALELAQVAEEAGIANGRKPSGVAAACIYRVAEACCWVVIQDTVADAANVTPVTLRGRVEALDEALSD